MVAAESAVRVYLPATVPMLAELARSGVLGPAPLAGHAVTAAVRECYDGDEEELEYVAFVRAAQQALELLRDDPSAARLRVVVSVDVPPRLLDTVGSVGSDASGGDASGGDVAASDASASELGDGDPGDSRVRVAEPVRLDAGAAVHCDSADAATLVDAAMTAAADGDGQQPAVAAMEDEALEWYDVTELEQLVDDRSR